MTRVKELKKRIEQMREGLFETVKGIINITSTAIRIHEISNLKDPEQRAGYRSMLENALRALELLDDEVVA